MAITQLRAQTTYDNMEPLLAILQEHAVPKYFDRVELVDNTASAKGACDKYYISCYIGELEFLRIYNGMNYYTSANYYGGIVVRRSNGGTVSAYSNVSSSGVYYPIEYVWVCNSMMWFHNRFALAKDKNGNTVVIYQYQLSKPASSNNDYQYYALSPDDTSTNAYSVFFNAVGNVTGKYGLMPVFGQNSVVEGVWFPVLRMYSDLEDPAAATIDGKTYLVTRGLVALDE